MLLLELYWQTPSSFPCLEHTHTHTPTLSHCAVVIMCFFCVCVCVFFIEQFKQNNNWYADQLQISTRYLTGKITETIR